VERETGGRGIVAVASEQSTSRSRPSIREWFRDPGRLLWTIAAVCWVALLAAGHHHDLRIAQGASAGGVAVSVLLLAGAWLEMTAAMMLPTTIPMVRMFTVVSARAPRTTAVRAAFLAGYLALWLAFALAAVLLATGIRAWTAPTQLSWMATRPHLVLAAILAIAGVFQLTSLKDRCLTECRDPRAFLFTHYRRGIRGAWTLGLRHGVSCLGCCWALMLIMFGTGLGNVLAMLVLTAVMLVEKTASWGRRIVTPLGVGLMVAAALMGLYGDRLSGWGLYEPLQSPTSMHHH
jgi:predicted metal-binding membrane protein